MNKHERDDNEYPLAYFITFRTHGAWLHGDPRTSVDRHGKNIYGSERIGLDPVFSVTMDRNMSTKPIQLDGKQRADVEHAIREVCRYCSYKLFGLHVRTNHAHVVASGQCSPNTMMQAFKANATREMREAGLITEATRIWARGGSTRYLWKPKNVERALHYTLYGQGDELPDF